MAEPAQADSEETSYESQSKSHLDFENRSPELLICKK